MVDAADAATLAAAETGGGKEVVGGAVDGFDLEGAFGAGAGAGAGFF